MRSWFLAAIALIALPVAAEAKPRPATCSIKSNGTSDYRGPCRFTPDEKGSFAIEPLRQRFFPGGISQISVWMISPGVAEVRGLTREGINSRWGEARRSRKYPACWTGDDFTICAR